MGQHYMTYPERIRLETMLKFKAPVSQIARELGFSRQTIYNEIRRGEYDYLNNDRGQYQMEKRYSADKAQQIHNRANRNRGRELKIGGDIAYANFLEQKILKDKFSPAAALAAARTKGFKTTLSVNTIYNYIYNGIFYQLTSNDLWEWPNRRKKKKRPTPRVAHDQLPSIEQRPDHISNRQDLGHWEMDLIVGKGQKQSLLVLAERISRQIIIKKIVDKKASTVVAAIDELEAGTPDFKNRIQSITTDNGPEFLDYDGLRRSINGGIRFELYYCHSYASWEKGTIERSNRIIRRFFPKGTDFTGITKEQVAAVQNWINDYPRKILNWMTPNQMAA